MLNIRTVIKINLSLLVPLCIFTLSLGCVKKRSEIEKQGSQLEDLISVEKISEWSHSIQTGDKVNYSSVTSSETLRVQPIQKTVTYCPANIGIKEKKNNECPVDKVTEQVLINMQGIVDFSTNSPLIKGHTSKIKLIADPNTSYPIVYRITPNYLKVFKKVHYTKVSHYEIPYSERHGPYFLVPLGGFEVSFFDIDNERKSDDNLKSHIKNKYAVSKEDYKKARYISIDHDSFIPFVPLEEKKDVFPASYFLEGEWYFSRALISAKPGQEDSLGFFYGGVSTEFQWANKVSFKIHRGLLRGYNVAISDDKVAATKDSDQVDDVISIPVEWYDSRATHSGRNATGLKEQRWNIKNHHERKYGKIYFAAIGALESFDSRDILFSGLISGKKLEDLQVQENSFSITLLNLANGKKTRYSFLRAKPRNYTEKQYFIYDKNVFGAFKTQKPYIYTSKDERRNDVEKNIVVNRYNPKGDDIVFRFSSETPTWEEVQKNKDLLQMDYREVGRRCVQYWNRAFQVAGTNVSVRLDESRDAELGDLDSNIINIMATVNESGSLGVGPSLADPETGEILSGAANVYISAQKNQYTRLMRDYIRVRSDYIKDYAFSKEIKEGRPLLGHFYKEVEHYCPEASKYAVSLKGKSQAESETENKVINNCLSKLLPQKFVLITCHEMGHVFGLRHNFEASADYDNSYKDLEHMKKVYPEAQFPEIYEEYYSKPEFFAQGSSVMDYQPTHSPNLVVPGLYDIAALAFLYGDRIEKKGTRENSSNGFGQLVKYDLKKPLRNQKVFADDAVSYRFCTDGDVLVKKGVSRKISPFCERHDYGASPHALLDFYFDRFRDHLVLRGRKWDKIGVSGYSPKFLAHHIDQMTAVMKLWRSYLFDHTGRNQAYLQGYQAQDSYNDLMNEINQSFAHPEYIGVSKKYSDYLMNIINIPDYFCMGIDNNSDRKALIPQKDIKLFRFSKIFTEITAKTSNKIVKGCEDPAVAEYIEAQGDWSYFGELGYPLNDVRFSSLTEDKDESIDIAGITGIRVEALKKLSSPLDSGGSAALKKRDFLPNPLDEYTLQKTLKKTAEEKLFEGLEISPLIEEILSEKNYQLAKKENNKPIKVFKTSSLLYVDALAALARRTAGQTLLTPPEQEKARKPYMMYTARTYNYKQYGENHYHFNTGSGKFFVFASETESVSYRVIEALRKTEEPLRTNIEHIDPSVQEGLYQLAEMVKFLPANDKHNRVFGLDQLSQLINHLKLILNDRPDVDVSLKTEAMKAWFQRIFTVDAHLKKVAAVAQGASAAAEGGSAPLSQEEAAQILQKISNSREALGQYLEKYHNLKLSDFTQVGFAQTWIKNQSQEIQSYWDDHILTQVENWVTFFNEEQEEYKAQQASLTIMIGSGLLPIKRGE